MEFQKGKKRARKRGIASIEIEDVDTPGRGAEAPNDARGAQNDDATLPLALRPPTHLIGRVFSQLDCVDLVQCSLVCKQWYRDSAELREGWKNEFIEACNMYGLGIKRETHPPSSTCSIKGLHSWCP